MLSSVSVVRHFWTAFSSVSRHFLRLASRSERIFVRACVEEEVMLRVEKVRMLVLEEVVDCIANNFKCAIIVYRYRASGFLRGGNETGSVGRRKQVKFEVRRKILLWDLRK
jgi:hypothetical protein